MLRYLTFRIDDVSPYMDFPSFDKTMHLLNDYGCKPLLGVVPNNMDNEIIYNKENVDFWSLMKRYQADGCVIGMHGFTHVYEIKSKNLVTYKKVSEFAGLPYLEQKRKIENGKRIMRDNGLNPTVFFAPSHTFDRITLQCLREEGFLVVSDGRSFYPYNYKGLKHVPVKYYGLPKHIVGTVTVALHPCNNIKESYDRLENYLKRYQEYVVDYKKVMMVPNGSLFFGKTVEQITKIYDVTLKDTVIATKGKIYKLLK